MYILTNIHTFTKQQQHTQNTNRINHQSKQHEHNSKMTKPNITHTTTNTNTHKTIITIIINKTTSQNKTDT